ncbi:GNAT family N-acetyltransferase [Aquimarina sediminis]|uniref:GNAT family N-acetyltransferase n=1 Tax=Aquimarina sediminis TaxID=2070536 RepID=UPI0013E8ACE6|nr:GNAT family N-acetyltransferase [Aquimarina sediminis]
MEKLKLIKAQATDRDFLFGLRKLTMVEHLEKAGINLSDAEHLSRVNFNYECAFVVFKSNKKVGVLKYEEREDTIEILQIQILPDYQGQGVGKSLIEDLVTKSRDLNKRLQLKVLKENPAKKLYERIGFGIISQDDDQFLMQL